jgi:parallel beta-helix repeat protein
MSTHNSSTFTAGDTLYLCDTGGIYRSTMTIPSFGSAGSPITYQNAPGQSPAIYGSSTASGWSDQGSNIWRYDTQITTDPDVIFLNGVYGLEEFTYGGMNAQGEWYYDAAGDYLYLYSTSDPDTTYSSIEYGVRNNGISWEYKPRNYITIDGITLKYFRREPIYIFNSNNVTIKNSTIVGAGPPEITGRTSTAKVSNSHGILVEQSNNCLIDKNVISETGGHSVFLMSSSNNTIQRNTFSKSYHSMVDLQRDSPGSTNANIVRYNLFYFPVGFDDAGPAVYTEGWSAANNPLCTPGVCTVDSTEIYYNVIYDLSASTQNRQGVQLEVNTGGTTKIYNNTIYNPKNYGIYIVNGTGSVEIKNNIFYGTGGLDHRLVYISNASNKTVNNNLYYRTSGIFAVVGGTVYSSWATYKAGTGFESAGVNADPLMTNPAGAVFTLAASSPAINAGTNAGLTADYGGTTITGNPDIGAFEYVGGTFQNKTPNSPQILRIL